MPGADLAGDLEASGDLTIVAEIGGLPRRIKRSRDWAEFIQNQELDRADLVRVERRGAEPVDMLAAEVPELRALFDKLYPNADVRADLNVANEPTAPSDSQVKAPVSTGAKSDETKSGKRRKKEDAEKPNSDSGPDESLAVAKVKSVDTKTVPTTVAVAAPASGTARAYGSSPVPQGTPAAIFPPSVVEANKRNARNIIIGAVIFIFVVWFISLISSSTKVSGPSGTGADAGSSDQSGSATVVTVFTQREVAVRNAPTTINTLPIAKLPLGTALEGVWVTGNDGQSQWLKITTGDYAGDFVWGGNLSAANASPPTASLPLPGDLTAPASPPPTVTAPTDTGTPAATTDAPAPATTSPSPSFDCRRANNWAETTVCSTPSLVALDNAMAAAYRALIGSSSRSAARQLVQSQRYWLQQRAQCQQNFNSLACMDTLYRQRIATLSSPAPLANIVSPVTTPTPDSNTDSGDSPQSRDQPAVLPANPCPQPTPPPAVDGNSVTAADMRAAHDRVMAFLRDSDNYQTCVLRRMPAADAQGLIAANQGLKERVGADFNAAILAFRARN